MICSHNNINNSYCEMENESYNDNSFCYTDDCKDFVLKEDKENNEESININKQ